MKLVYLEWHDAVSNAAWFTREEADAWGHATDWTIREAGWLVEEAKDHVVIATSWKPEDTWCEEKFCNMHKIPRSWIKKYKVLKVTK